MSKVAIQGNASGTGTFTIQSPATNTDRVLTLPDEAGTVLTSASTVAESQMFSGFANGITVIDQWQLTTNIGLGNDTVTFLSANLSQYTGDRYASVGTGMSRSSEIFTFPETGLWAINIVDTIEKNGDVRQVSVRMQITSNNSSYTDAMFTEHNLNYTGNEAYSSGYVEGIFNITDVTQQKVKFYGYSNDAASTLIGSTTEIRTGFRFVRLGDSA